MVKFSYIYYLQSSLSIAAVFYSIVLLLKWIFFSKYNLPFAIFGLQLDIELLSIKQSPFG